MFAQKNFGDVAFALAGPVFVALRAQHIDTVIGEDEATRRARTTGINRDRHRALAGGKDRRHETAAIGANQPLAPDRLACENLGSGDGARDIIGNARVVGAGEQACRNGIGRPVLPAQIRFRNGAPHGKINSCNKHLRRRCTRCFPGDDLRFRRRRIAVPAHQHEGADACCDGNAENDDLGSFHDGYTHASLVMTPGVDHANVNLWLIRYVAWGLGEEKYNSWFKGRVVRRSSEVAQLRSREGSVGIEPYRRRAHQPSGFSSASAARFSTT